MVVAGSLLALASGCSNDISGQVPDFSLQDVNASSASFGTDVSPRDYLGQASAWYFGHAT